MKMKVDDKVGKKWDAISKEDIEQRIDQMLLEIFEGSNPKKMSQYEKRKKIYEYLVRTKRYNNEYLSNILNNFTPKDPYDEFVEPLLSNLGICNGFSQIYKLLLEEVGIYSLCVCCMVKHDNQFVGHQLNLVYNEESKTFSFDDITYGIIKQTIDGYFDYDNPEETDEMQGCIPLCDDIKWMILGDGLINYYAKREKNIIEKPNGIRIEDTMLRELFDFESIGIKIKTMKKIEYKK